MYILEFTEYLNSHFQIGWVRFFGVGFWSVAFPAGQCTSPQLHPCHRLFDQNVQTLLPVTWLFPKFRSCRYETIEEMKEAVTKVIDTLTQEDFHGAFQKLLALYNKYIAAGGDYFEGD